MNAKKYIGLGMIVLGGIGAEETVRRAVNHWNAGDSAYNAHSEALDHERSLANSRNFRIDELHRAEGKAICCDIIRNGYYDSCKNLDYLCSNVNQERAQLESEIAQLQTEYNLAVQHSEKLQEESKFHMDWFFLDLSGATFSLFLGGCGLYLLSSRRKEEQAGKSGELQ